MADSSKTTSKQHPLTLPPSFSPDALDALTSLAIDLARVRTGLIQASDPQHQPPPQAGEKPALAVKDVPGATDAIKHKIQNARAVVKALPDMARGMEEQEREAKELEERIERQRKVLLALREKGENRGDADRMEM